MLKYACERKGLFSLVGLTQSPSQNNMMAFIAELFCVFEKVKPTFVQPMDSQDMKDGTASLHNMMLHAHNFMFIYMYPYTLL